MTYDIEKEISPDSPVHHRTKAIRELREAVLNQQWEDVRTCKTTTSGGGCHSKYLTCIKDLYKSEVLHFIFILFVSNNRERQNVCGI